ncbi:MAG: histidine kinase [Longimonas sp.]|uniref:sensor histidine kinase n=1 Tax=Longimonas sp. TaxID=2039626 RepID=UPI0033492E4B
MRKLFRLAGWVGLVGIATGTIVFFSIGSLNAPGTHSRVWIRSVTHAAIYTGIMTAVIMGVGNWVYTWLPLQSYRAVAGHVVGQAGATLVSFAVATGVNHVLFPDTFSLSGPVLFIVAGVAAGTAALWSSFAYMAEFFQRMQAAQSAAYDARLQVLRAQINPHFLFNAFNTVAALIRTRPKEAEAVVEDLSDLFRYTLHASEHDTARLTDELDAVRRYLAIEKARFQDRLQVDVQVDDGLRQMHMPSMTLQPLVENAVKHGVGQTTAPCEVSIQAHDLRDRWQLRVSDTGPGFDTTNPDVICSRGTGLSNVRERLSLFVGGHEALLIERQGVVITLPKRTTTASDFSDS